jgi:hypothetical protein
MSSEREKTNTRYFDSYAQLQRIRFAATRAELQPPE